MTETHVSVPDGAGRLRGFVALASGIGCGIFSFAVAAGLTRSWPAGLGLGVLAAALCSWAFWKHPIVELDESASPRALKIVSAVAAVVALLQLGRLAVFMVSAAQVSCSSLPSSDWELRHSCLSAYYIAGKAASGTGNIYEGSLYTAPDDDPKARRKPLMLGPFRVDVFEYPPPFLILPRALLPLAPDFTTFRPLWFGLNGAVILLAMLVVARRLGAAAGTRALLLSPLIWLAFPTLSTMQKGNVQALVIAISMLAMDLFERRRPAAGGALLAFATVSKLFPGLLAVYLLARKQWRALAWTTAFGAVFVVASLLDTGWKPFAAFLGHLPGLVGGEAFPAFRNPAAIAINFSIPGLVFKLKLFGVAGMSFGAAKIVGWIYTAIAVWVILLLARRNPAGSERPVVWMAILIVATLRSPFLPQAYAAFPPLWLLVLLAAHAAPTARTLVATLAGWIALNIFWPMDWAMDPRKLALISAVPQAVTIALAALVVRRVLASGPRPASSLAGGTGPVPAVG